MTTTSKTSKVNDADVSTSTVEAALIRLRSLLSVRDHTDFEIRSKLSATFSGAELDEALKIARSRGWLQTPEEQSARIAAKLASKNKGIAFINETLESRGLPPLPSAYFADSSDGDSVSDDARARQLLDSKLARGVSLDYVSKKKYYRLLASRGFEEDVIQSVLRNAGFADDDGQDDSQF